MSKDQPYIIPIAVRQIVHEKCQKSLLAAVVSSGNCPREPSLNLLGAKPVFSARTKNDALRIHRSAMAFRLSRPLSKCFPATLSMFLKMLMSFMM
jgi:hypothetical protein